MLGAMAADGGNWRTFGDFIKAQRKLHEMSLRQLSEVAKVSNPYLSQLERGMYKPSVEVLKNLASALKMSTETMLAQAGLLPDDSPANTADVEAAIRLDQSLTTEQKQALLSVYRGFGGKAAPSPSPPRPAATSAARKPRTPRPKRS
jgi:transcriptional regulator with XRE-family HTH domain